jgi:hypothetical protein
MRVGIIVGVVLGMFYLVSVHEDPGTVSDPFPQAELIDPKFLGNMLAQNTKDGILRYMGDDKVHKIDVGAWIMKDRLLYRLGSSDEEGGTIAFPFDSSTLVGCAFTHPKQSVSWDDVSTRVLFTGRNDKPTSLDSRCSFFVSPTHKLRSIVCESYNPTLDPDNGVALCVDSESETNFLNRDSHDFISMRLQVLYDILSDLRREKRFARDLARYHIT